MKLQYQSKLESTGRAHLKDRFDGLVRTIVAPLEIEVNKFKLTLKGDQYTFILHLTEEERESYTVKQISDYAKTDEFKFEMLSQLRDEYSSLKQDFLKNDTDFVNIIIRNFRQGLI